MIPTHLSNFDFDFFSIKFVTFVLCFADLIHKLIGRGKQLLAVKFVFEFQLTDKFPPVPLLKSYLKESKNLAKKVCREGKHSLKSLVILLPH